ncbi:YhdP family protein [Cupriavidus sp. SZY C1]|uniref:YhdP family protein n=1 Tax=Cupriavidus sp. SZY C1 TaxID=3055037 RepID=UPI0028B97884|nr:YhdP family protein [Cupriavidus sp. SZY C1]MDT6961104.1 YhdP family protein [Cupriavidus sp. SZY C1]
MSSRSTAPDDGSTAPRAGGDRTASAAASVAPPVAASQVPHPHVPGRGRRALAHVRRWPRAVWDGLGTLGRHPAWRRLWRMLARIVAVLAALAVVAVLLIRFVLWPQAHAARQWLERQGSAALSAQLTIGQLDTYWDGWHPAFRASNVQAVDDQRRMLLSTATLEGRLSWQSVPALALQFASLTADRADVLVRRTPAGRVLVAGMPIEASQQSTDNDPFLNWLLSQGRIELKSGNLRWLDEKAGLPQLEVADIHFLASRHGAQHTVRLDASSTSLAPQPLVFQASLRHDYLYGAGNWQHWTGQANWAFNQLQLPVVQRYLAIFDRVDSGVFSTDGTIDFRGGHVLRSQTRLRASGVDLRLTGAPEPLKLANAQALLLHKGDRNGNHSLTIDTLLWQAEPQAGPPSATDPSWREGMRKVTMDWARDNDGQLRKFALRAPTFDLNTVRALATSLPIDTAVLRQLRALQPAGHIDNLDVAWARERAGLLARAPGTPHYTVQGTLRGVSVNSQPAVPAVGPDGKPHTGTPGFTRLSGNFSFDDRQGSARVDSTGATLSFPGVFDDPLVPFDELRGEVRWRRDNGKLVVTTDGIRFANADTAGTVRGNWREGGDGHSGIADLSGELDRALAHRVPRYLPSTMPATRHYLEGALVGGEAYNVKFLVKGDLYHFPFHPPFAKAGDFRVEVPIRNVSYQIAPHETGPNVGGAANGTGNGTGNGNGTPGMAWPDFTDISGTLLFERSTMSFQAKQAGVRGIPGIVLRDVNGQIDDLSDHGHLMVDGGATGPVQGFLRYVAATPVKGWTGNVTEAAHAPGQGELRLKLDLPLSHAAGAKVNGEFRFPGNDVTLMPELPTLFGATGAVAFDEHGFQLHNVRGRFVGGETRITGGTQPDGTTRVAIGGTATAQGLRDALGAGAGGLGARIDGTTPYTAVVGVRDKRLQVQVASDLNGLALNLPSPLGKPAGQDLPLRFDLRPSASRPALDDMTIQAGNVASVRYVLRRGETTDVVSGGIGIGQPAPQPASGVTAAITADKLDLDGWRMVLDTGSGERKPADTVDRSSPFLPERVGVRARTLDAFGRSLDDVSIDAAREAAGWNLQMASRQITGNGQWRRDSSNPTGALTVRLSHLDIPEATDDGHAAEAITRSVEEMPALDLVVDRFVLHGRDFGKLAVKAHTSHTDNQPVWTLDSLSIEQPGATLTGSGSWRLPRRLREAAAQGNVSPTEGRRTLLNFKLDIRNAGDVLDRFGLPHTVRDGNGALEGRIAWRGSPMSIDYPTLSGRLNLKLENGQILSVEPGAARLLGVLSLQSLLRFATLDFRSLSSKGLVFDDISGSGTIENGVGKIDEFRFKSSQVMASMTGTADLLRETQDVQVDVVPRINATTTSVAAAFINPVLGIGTLAAQLLFADEFSKVFTQHYHVSGSWADPKVSKVEDNKSRPAPVQDRSSVFPR